MSIFLLIFAVSAVVGSSIAATCNTITSLSNTWPTSQEGTVSFSVPVRVSAWKVVMTFDKAVSALSAWDGISLGCTSGGRVCTYANEVYNDVQALGDLLQLGYQIEFATTSVPPKLVSVTFNGIAICSSGTVATTTPAPTKAPVTTTSAPAAGLINGNRLYGGQSLLTGNYMMSNNKCIKLIMQPDGNLVLYQMPAQTALWATRTQGTGSVKAVMQGDGNLVVYTATNFPTWASRTNGKNGAILIVQDDGNLVIYDTSSAPIWASNTMNNYCLGIPTPTTPRATTAPPATTPPPKATTTTATPAPTPKPTTTTPRVPATGRCADYSSLINKSMLFYEAQRSGKLPQTNRIPWRKDSALDDGSQEGVDLAGGYYDAGDYVKFGFTMAYTITTLAMGGIFFPEGYAKSGQTNYLLDAVKWGTDYFIKCHVSANELYGQVGDGVADHELWCRPEDMAKPRPAFKITAAKPGTDLACETAAAMAASSILFKASNPAYSAVLLEHAKQLYSFGTTNLGLYQNSITNAAEFYSSASYDDEIAWAAAWLHKATEDPKYLNDAKNAYSRNGFSSNQEVLCWDSKYAGVKILLAQITKDLTYLNDVVSLCDYFISGVPRSPKGLIFFTDISAWGSLRYSSTAAFVCLMASDLNIAADKKNAYQAFAKDQMEYILGKTGRSFVVGFEPNPPINAHHASSSCPNYPETCDWSFFDSTTPNVHVLEGALVGGPDAPDDQFTDRRNAYSETEVTLDYNAGYQGLLAGLMKACP